MYSFHQIVYFAICIVSGVFARALNQKPLTAWDQDRASGSTWMAVEQDDSICNAGSPHFTGLINVTEHKSIFFWFFESRHDPQTRPVIVWLNGGPAASSMLGLFEEMGPCSINEYGNDTIRNLETWVNEYNVLYIDQPAGVGFSTADNETEWPTTLKVASKDFSTTLRVFFQEIFPQFNSLPLYIAGESFGGRYVPRYALDIMKYRDFEETATSKSIPPIEGIILVNSLIDGTYTTVGQYDLLCTGNYNVLPYNETACQAMAELVPECEKLGALCRATMDPYVCQQAGSYCDNIEVYFTREVMASDRNPYDLRKHCDYPPICIATNDSALVSYLNRPEIQERLLLPQPISYDLINFDLNSRWRAEVEGYLPSTPQLTYLLDEAKVRILVVNGKYDSLSNEPGCFRQYDELPWLGHAPFRAQSRRNWYWTDGSGKEILGGSIKQTPLLTVAGVDNAGHMAPQDQRGAVLSLIKNWTT